MDREKLFKEFLEECKNRREWIGQGNPNADILIIGKESYINALITNQIEIQKKLQEQYERCKRGVFGTATFDPQNKTWCNYQILIKKVYGSQREFNLGLFDFEKYAFTTELSSVPRKQSNYSKAKSSIQDRLHFFKESKFIQSFPVIILACGGYVRNNDDKVREIDNTFHVEFCQEYGNKESKNRFWTHIDKNDPRRLVIHTRQLSNGVSYEMIDMMASFIRDHLRKYGFI